LFSFDQEKENNHQVEAVTVIEMGEPAEMKRNFPSSVIKFILIPNWAVLHQFHFLS